MSTLEFKDENGRDVMLSLLRGHLGNRQKHKRQFPLFFLLSVLIVFFGLVSNVKPALAIDLLPFFCPDCVGESYHQRNIMSNGSECFYTYSATVNQKTGFYIVKPCSGLMDFEEFNYDGQFIYHLKDTTWATGPNQNVHCMDRSDEAFSTYLNGFFGTQNGPCEGFIPHMDSEGGIWVPRHMNVSQSLSHGVTIVGFSERDCYCCRAPYTGPTWRTVKLVSFEPNFDLRNGLGRRDVIRIAVMYGPGQGENFWYARNYGWIAFGHVGVWNPNKWGPGKGDWDIPPDIPKSLFDGDITHIIGIDYNGRQRELTCSVPPQPSPMPDVYIEDLWWSPSNPRPGDQVQFNVRVRNGGSAGTGADVGVGYFVDEGSGYRQVGWGIRGQMRASEVSENFGMQQRWVAPRSGNFRVLAIVDDVNRFQESNENNNGREETLTVSGVVPLPDVYIEDLWWTPSNPRPGDQVQFNVRVRNGGSVSTGADVGVGYFVDGNFVGWGIRGPMGSYEVSNALGMVQRWTANAGSHNIRAVVDDINRFQESNEGNNVFEKRMNIGGSSNPYPNCPCRGDVNNYCLYSPSTAGCPMTSPGGYCDPNRDGSFTDADWLRGYNEFQQYCR